MKNYLVGICATLIFLSSCVSPNNKESKTPTWESMFNGKNLEGWQMKIKGYEPGNNYGQTFRVEGGILQVNYDQYERFDQKFGALYHKNPYTDYRLKVEYRFVGDTATGAPPWGFRDSGIQYYCQSPASMGLVQNFPVSLEYNLHGGNGTEDRPNGQICTNGTLVDINGVQSTSYCTPATVPVTLHGDQWVTAEIDVRGNSISHWVNGVEILTFTNPRYNPEHELAKTFITGDNQKIEPGYISLQSNSHPIEFRKIEIKPYP